MGELSAELTERVDIHYDSEGLRLSKTVGTTVYNYYYAGGKLVKETVYVNGTRMHVLDFIYDHSGHPYALKHKTGGVTTTYYYITNLQGDVLSLVDTSGTAAATYTYDPYGKPLTATGTLANINPLRYRGYVYDTETGLYYLQSRYYDPAIGRFINADAFASTGQGMLGNNMFAYCLNCPSFCADPSGRFASGENPSAEFFQNFERWILDVIETDENEKPTAKAAIKRAAKSFFHCLEFSAGIGMGYYAGLDVLDISVEGGMYGNLICIQYQNGQFYFGEELTNGALIFSIGSEEIGFLDSMYREFGGEYESNSWKWVNTEKDSWTIAGASAYFIAGGSFSVGFGLNSFIEQIDQLINELQ